LNTSSFRSDLEKEQRLGQFLDTMYTKALKHYNHKRIHDLKNQHQGVDVIFTSKTTRKQYTIDEKAQLDYINEDLPTFAFELSYLKKGRLREGWLFDKNKKTDFYALVTGIYYEANEFTSCKITLVNRRKLLQKLCEIGLDKKDGVIFRKNDKHGKIIVPQLNQKKEGYLFLSKHNKEEQPMNLILKLAWLNELQISKCLL